MKEMKKKIPILGPLMGLIDSRKAQVAIGSVIAVVLVQRAGMSEVEANAISGAIVLLAGVLIHAIMKEDVADKMNGNGNGKNGKGVNVHVSGFVGDAEELAKEISEAISTTRGGEGEEEGGAQDG